MPETKPRVAVVLFNLGGPDRLSSVRPFLLNLFTDPAILRVPFLIRPLLARLIAWRRVKPARENYRLMGGSSPLLRLTQDQARALEAALPEFETKCFVAMRYWHPFSDAAARAVRSWNPDQVVLVPLYPHFSTTTTGSSLTAWRDAAAKAGLAKPTHGLCCYSTDAAYVQATAALLRQAYDRTEGPVRVLFSAHGLPQVIVDKGDPYRFHIEATAQAVADEMHVPGLDWQICFQSRATPQKWLEPNIDQALHRAAEDGVGVLVSPIAFVSEHSETLVELDIEYAELAERLGILSYLRVPTQNSDPGFIAALARLVREALGRGVGMCSSEGGRVCPVENSECPLRRAA